MKDAYSFDRDEEGVRASFEANRDAYKKIFARCALETYDVQAESGIMGGKFSIDFLAPSGSGENTLVRCENGDYAGDLEVAEAVPNDAVLPDPLSAPEEVDTPGVTTIEGLAELLRDRPVGDVESDAGRQAGRHSRARARPRRRPAQRDEALRRAARRIPSRDGRRDQSCVRRWRRLPRAPSVSRAR